MRERNPLVTPPLETRLPGDAKESLLPNSPRPSWASAPVPQPSTPPRGPRSLRRPSRTSPNCHHRVPAGPASRPPPSLASHWLAPPSLPAPGPASPPSAFRGPPRFPRRAADVCLSRVAWAPATFHPASPRERPRRPRARPRPPARSFAVPRARALPPARPPATPQAETPARRPAPRGGACGSRGPSRPPPARPSAAPHARETR